MARRELSNKVVPFADDLNQALKTVYDDINDIINSVNSVQKNPLETDGKAGDIRVVDVPGGTLTSPLHKLQFKTSEGWATINASNVGQADFSMPAYNPVHQQYEYVDTSDVFTTTFTDIGRINLKDNSIDLDKIKTADLIKDADTFANVDTKLMTAAAVKNQIDSSLPTGNAIIDWTADQGGTNIHAGNYINTTYSVMASDNSYAAGLVAAGSGTHNSEFLRKDGTWSAIPASNPAHKILDDDNDEFIVNANKEIKFTSAVGSAGVNITGAGTSSDPYVVAITSPNTTYSTGNNGLVPAAGSAGQFLAHNGAFATPPDTNTNQLTTFNIGVDTNTNATTIAHGETLTLTGGTGISTETTADGTVTLTNTVTNTDVDVSVGNLETRLGEIDTSITIGNANTINTTIAGNLTIGHDTITMSDDGNSKPLIEMTNTADSNKPCVFTMTKDRVTGVGTSNLDSIGQFQFKGFDAGGNSTIYSTQAHKANSVVAGAERGNYQHQLNSNGFLRNAISHTSGDGVVDTVIGYGINSNTDIAGNVSAAGKFYLNDGYSTWIEGDDEGMSFYGDSAILGFFHGDEIKLEALLRLKEKSSSGSVPAAYGQVWVKNSTPNELYFTNDAGNDIQLTSGSSAAGGGGTSRWHQAFGGYKSNNSSTTSYYMPYYPWNQAWNNADSSPTTLAYPDAYAAIWIAPAAGTLTRIDVIIRGTSTDDVQFYVFKGDIATAGESSTSLTQIGASGVIDITSSAETHYATASISSSNTFAAGDALWVMYKKEEHNFATTHYFSGSISGEYS